MKNYYAQKFKYLIIVFTWIPIFSFHYHCKCFSIIKNSFLGFQDLEEAGAEIELAPVGKQTLPDGSQIDLPPVILGHLGSDPNKKTVCIYGHLDVQPAKLVRESNIIIVKSILRPF